MTLLVRDEADIIAPMLEYHLAAGVDVILVTDNGSIDGTREILSRYEHLGRVFIEDDPVQDKNQSAKVTRMARRAATEFHADWVINADADEFFVPVDRSLTLAALFERLPTDIVSAVLPVVDMTGTPGVEGVGIDRLLYRDERTEATLFGRSGLHAHATHDAIHIGSPEVTVAQGNHYVSLASAGSIPPELMLESLHFPWRSFRQFRTKVVNAGVAYESNPNVNPSPRHHGMRDFRFWRAGVLEDAYLYRHPPIDECGSDELREDAWLSHRLGELLRSGDAVCSDLLARALDLAGDAYPETRVDRARVVMPPVLAIDELRSEDVIAHNTFVAGLKAEADRTEEKLRAAKDESERFRAEATSLEAELVRIRGERAYRLASLVACGSRKVFAPFHRIKPEDRNP